MALYPITVADAEEMGVPVCFSEEYAFHEQRGTLPPYAGPVEPDYYREDVDYFDPRDYDLGPAPEPEPCRGPARTFEFLGLPERWRGHEGGCWDLHAPSEPCPPPF